MIRQTLHCLIIWGLPRIKTLYLSFAFMKGSLPITESLLFFWSAVTDTDVNLLSSFSRGKHENLGVEGRVR
jgi:hypothetical protein